MKREFTRRGYVLLMFGIFFGMLYFGLSNSKWGNAIVRDWKELDVDFSSTKRQTELPYLKVLGDLDADNYDEFLIYDSYEKAICYNSSEEYLNPILYDEWGDFINESIILLNKTESFSTYGYSSIGVYTLSQENPKDFIWSITFSDGDILKCDIVQDINDDGIKDILLCIGVVNPLPSVKDFGYSDLATLFIENPWLFENYYIIDQKNSSLLITPKYTSYRLSIYSGLTGILLDRNDLSKIVFDQCLIDVAVLDTEVSDLTKPHVILLTSNLSAPRFYSPIYYRSSVNNRSQVQWVLMEYVGSLQNVSIVNYNWQLIGLQFNPMQYLWVKNYTPFSSTTEQERFIVNWAQMGMKILYDDPLYNSLEFNTSVYEANFIDIESFGQNFVVKFTPLVGYISSMESIAFVFYNENVTLFSVWNSTDGLSLWEGAPNINYIISPKDMSGNGFGQVNGYFANDTAINLLYINASTGQIISKAILEENASMLITSSNFNAIKFILSSDDMIGNDEVFEIMAVALNRSYYSEEGLENALDPIQIARFSLNMSSEVNLIYSPIMEHYFNLILPENFTMDDFELIPIGVDLDRDNVQDYLFKYMKDRPKRIQNTNPSIFNEFQDVTLLSGAVKKLQPRYIKSAMSNYVQKFNDVIYLDNKNLNDFLYFFHDPGDTRRISVVSVCYNEIIYVQDLNMFKNNVSFTNFFNEADVLLNIILGLCAFCIIILPLEFKKRERTGLKHFDVQTQSAKSLTQVLWVMILMMFVLIGSILYFFTISINLTIGFTTIAISPEGQLIWFILLYPAIFVMVAILPLLYNASGPTLAQKIFINPQKKIYDLINKRHKRKDYRVIIIDMEEKSYVSAFLRIKRMLLPILISFTIGTAIYQGLGPNGALFNALYPLIDRPLTNPENLGIITENMVNPKEVWIEIGKFARYCVIPMIITYLATTILFPGAWILDDAGVCFYQKSMKKRDISDIDSISKFFLNMISGLFGFTAIVSFVQLFIPMLTRIDELIINLQTMTDLPPILGVLVLIGALVIFPFFAGILLMTATQQIMEKNYAKNVLRLHTKMEESGIKTIPLDLSAVLSAEKQKWFMEREESSNLG